jgi:hypothetical protein
LGEEKQKFLFWGDEEGVVVKILQSSATLAASRPASFVQT